MADKTLKRYFREINLEALNDREKIALVDLVTRTQSLFSTVTSFLFNPQDYTPCIRLSEDAKSVTQMGFSNNGLMVGDIPDQDENIRNMAFMWMATSRLESLIPKSIGNYPEFNNESGYDYSLQGTIPDTIGYFTNLTWLYLGYNDLKGEIPESIGNLSNLKELYLDHNNLTGNIPSSITKLKKLSVLWLNNNRLEGSIPTSIGNIENLTNLWLHNNQLTGCIPDSIGEIRGILGLLLHNNNFDSELPNNMARLQRLVGLGLNEELVTTNKEILRQIPFTNLYIDSDEPVDDFSVFLC